MKLSSLLKKIVGVWLLLFLLFPVAIANLVPTTVTGGAWSCDQPYKSTTPISCPGFFEFLEGTVNYGTQATFLLSFVVLIPFLYAEPILGNAWMYFVIFSQLLLFSFVAYVCYRFIKPRSDPTQNEWFELLLVIILALLVYVAI